MELLTSILLSKRFSFVFILSIFLGISVSSHAQCDPDALYDKIVSGFHQSFALTREGTYQAWGQNMAANGTTDVLVPKELNATNFSGLVGTPLKATIGGRGGNAEEQQVVLTTDGIYAWGREGFVLDGTLTSSTSIEKIGAITGGNSYRLPTGVNPEDVVMMQATFQTLVILTSSGNVWILTQVHGDIVANGTVTLGTKTWYKAKLNSTTDLTGVIAVRSMVTSADAGVVYALTSVGEIYTWGRNAYLGDGAVPADLNYATKMTLPSGVSGSNLKMIGVTGGALRNPSSSYSITTTYGNTYYLLTTSGTLYALGANNVRQCGDFTTTERKSWVNVKKTSTTNMTDVKIISVQEHDAWQPSASAITNSGVLYTWGRQERYMLGQSGTATQTCDPEIPTSFNTASDVAIFAELGGHTLVYVKEGSTRFCYVGHRIDGSMGDNTSTDAEEEYVH